MQEQTFDICQLYRRRLVESVSCSYDENEFFKQIQIICVY